MSSRSSLLRNLTLINNTFLAKKNLFTSSSLKAATPININEFEVRPPVKDDLPQIVTMCKDIWAGTDPHPGTFLRLLGMKNANQAVVVHKPTKKLVMSFCNVRFNCLRLPPIYGKFGTFVRPALSYTHSVPSTNDDPFCEIYNNAVEIAPEFRKTGIPQYFTNKLTSDQLAATPNAIRVIYNTFIEQYALGPAVHNGDPVTSLISANNCLMFEIPPKQLDLLAGMLKAAKGAGASTPAGAGSGGSKEEKAVFDALASLKSIPFERIHEDLKGSPYLARMLQAGRYLPTDIGPIPFDARNFIRDYDPFDSATLVGSGAKGIDSISSTTVWWSPAGVVTSVFFSGFNEAQLLAHVLRALAENRTRFEEEHKLREKLLGKQIEKRLLLSLFFSIRVDPHRVDGLCTKRLGFRPWPSTPAKEGEPSERELMEKMYLLNVYPEHDVNFNV